MKDISLNLPTWAFHLGYRLMDEQSWHAAYLMRGRQVIERFEGKGILNILEMEEYISRLENARG